MPPTASRLIVLLAIAAAGCSAYRHYQASKPAVVKQTEVRLSDAGFKSIAVDTSDRASLASNLPPHELRRYVADRGPVYWYYDPDQCACVYEGSGEAFDRYQMLIRQQNDTAEYAVESREQEVASLNALSGAYFPPPIFWYGAGGYYGSGWFGVGHGTTGGGHHGGGHHGGGHHSGGGGGHIGHGH